MSEIYYSISKLISHHRLFNFVIGERGNGKTFGAKEFVIDDFLKNKNEFIYLRRYKTESKKARDSFFDDIKKLDKYNDKELKTVGENFYIGDKICGYSMSLSVFNSIKSVSKPNVKTIIFDEFLILKKSNTHYLRDEVIKFLEFYETIARTRDVTVIFLANAITMMNPYFIYFKISDLKGRFTKIGSDILVELTNTPNYKELKKSTRFGKLIANTDYSKYSIDNEFLQDNNSFVEEKPSDSRLVVGFQIENKLIGVWFSPSTNLMYFSMKCNPQFRFIYALTVADQQPNMLLLKGQKMANIQRIKIAIKYGLIRFDSLKSKYYGQKAISLLTL